MTHLGFGGHEVWGLGSGVLSLTLRMFMGFDSGASKGRMKVPTLPLSHAWRPPIDSLEEAGLSK